MVLKTSNLYTKHLTNLCPMHTAILRICIVCVGSIYIASLCASAPSFTLFFALLLKVLRQKMTSTATLWRRLCIMLYLLWQSGFMHHGVDARISFSTRLNVSLWLSLSIGCHWWATIPSWTNKVLHVPLFSLGIRAVVYVVNCTLYFYQILKSKWPVRSQDV